MQISDSKFDDFQSYFRFLYKESNEKSTYQDEILRSILYALILEITGEYDAQYNLNAGAEIKSHDVSDKFFHLLAVYYKENRMVQFYADRLNFSSPSAFVQFFKKHTGTTPKKI